MKKETIAMGQPNRVLTYEEELKEYNDYWASPSIHRFPVSRPNAFSNAVQSHRLAKERRQKAESMREVLKDVDIKNVATGINSVVLGHGAIFYSPQYAWEPYEEAKSEPQPKMPAKQTIKYKI